MEKLFEKFEFNESTTCDIKEINGLKDSNIYTGQTLYIPEYQ